ncbi:hypothetical protein [Dictyobacter kobayashii]|uniref:Uncharacterized protein n=1 Tax=Dictyobacter kobayashii TaxID=2014872 RepID=A0A402ANP0_9CHLR|nr:hypothetical protein [Dictyobacter kobayashii]GCE20773.1 hypothetical protein KDK_45730 [Dictyobacter kobayashii]
MKQRASGIVLGVVGAIVLGFAVLAAIWQGVNAIGGLGYEPGVLKASKTGTNEATISLSTFPDSQVCHQDANAQQIEWVSYCPTTSLEVPANSLITVVINNYDSATKLVNPYFRQVQGTVGGVEMVNNKPMSQVSADNISHTFTLQSTPEEVHPLFVSVPIVAVPDDAPDAVTIAGNQYPRPNVISFQFRTGPAGTYIWHCYDPCGADRVPPYGFSGAMSTTGFMAGTLQVTNY